MKTGVAGDQTRDQDWTVFPHLHFNYAAPPRAADSH